MINLIKLIKIEDNVISFVENKNDNYTIEKIKECHKENINVRFVAHFVDYLKIEHFTDLSKLFKNRYIPDTIITVEDLIDKYLTDLLVFTFETNLIRNTKQHVRLISSDWYSNFTFKSYNSAVNNSSDILMSPNFPDLHITCSNDLTNKILLSNNKLINTIWKNGSAIAIKSKNTFFKNERMCFLDLSYSNAVGIVTLKSNSENGMFVIPTQYRSEYDFFITIKGCPIFLRKGIYFRKNNNIIVNWNYITNLPMFKEFSEEDLINDDNSFFCFVKCKKIYYRINNTIKDTDTLVRAYLPKPNDQIKANYMCYDVYNHQLFNMTFVEEKYINPIDENTKMNNIYIEYKKDNINRDFKLIQMIIVK